MRRKMAPCGHEVVPGMCQPAVCSVPQPPRQEWVGQCAPWQPGAPQNWEVGVNSGCYSDHWIVPWMSLTNVLGILGLFGRPRKLTSDHSDLQVLLHLQGWICYLRYQFGPWSCPEGDGGGSRMSRLSHGNLWNLQRGRPQFRAFDTVCQAMSGLNSWLFQAGRCNQDFRLTGSDFQRLVLKHYVEGQLFVDLFQAVYKYWVQCCKRWRKLGSSTMHRWIW